MKKFLKDLERLTFEEVSEGFGKTSEDFAERFLERFLKDLERLRRKISQKDFAERFRRKISQKGFGKTSQKGFGKTSQKDF